MVGSSLLLLLLSPLLLMVAVAVKLESPGPVFFIQDRVGARRVTKNGERRWETSTFRMYKFRSMVSDSDETLHRQHIEAFVGGTLQGAAGNARFKLADDDRITRVGRFCRRTSLDELPQLLNVLKGEMSLVGPRPVPTYEVAAYQPWHYERLDASPGVTGLWQIYGRGRVTFDEMMRMDIAYVRNQSTWLDLKLLLLTIPAVCRGTGAE